MFYFCKMQATGNDFILIDYINNKFDYSLKLLAEYLCDRHYGVGADGIIIIDKSNIADFKMRIFNIDGSEAEMCGNGIRCFAKYIFERKFTEKKEFSIETLAGLRNIKLIVEGKTVIGIKVDMGEPQFEFEKIPVIYLDSCKDDKIIIEDNEVYPISMGNPHAVCFIDNLEKIDINRIGKIIENYKFFPNKTNVEFVQIIDKKRIKVKVWERGVGETLSCGTGACAAAVISFLKKQTESRLIVDLPGGKLEINYEDKINKVELKGPAEFIYNGEMEI